MKVLAVGDIHTKQWIIYEVAEIIDCYDKIVFCGDYADNFNAEPMQTINTWRLMKQFVEDYPNRVNAVIGNHDFAYLQSETAGRSSGFNYITYTLINAPENRKLRDWLKSLPVAIEIDGVTYSHAGITDQWSGDESVNGLWNDTSPIWARPREFGGQTTYKNIPQVIGHNPSEKIWNPAPNVWCIDTFSENTDNSSRGDKTMIEVIDGKEFKITNIKEIYENNNYTANFEKEVS